MGVLARLGLDSAVALCIEFEGHLIGYVPPLVVYGSFEPLLGETYVLHSGAHISSPWFSCILAVDFLRVCSVYTRFIRVA